jgi:hypothetical protein
LIICFSDAASFSTSFFPAASAIFNFAGHLSSELSTSSLTDARRIIGRRSLELITLSLPSDYKTFRAVRMDVPAARKQSANDVRMSDFTSNGAFAGSN